MKRTLLFSASLLAIAAMNVNADNVQQNVARKVEKITAAPSPLKASLMRVEKGRTLLKTKAVKASRAIELAPQATAAEVSYEPLAMYVSLNSTMGYSFPNATIVPAYAPTGYMNTTPDFVSGNCSWEYNTWEGDENVFKTSTEDHLIVEYPFSNVSYPTLTYSGSNFQFGDWDNEGQMEHAVVMAGGRVEDRAQDGFYGVITTNFTLSGGFGAAPGTEGENEKLWQGWAETDAKVKGFGFPVLYCGSPYALNAVYFPYLEATGDQNAAIKVYVRPVDDEGKISDEIIAEGEAKLADAQPYFINSGATKTLGFTFYKDFMGMKQEFVPTITGNVFIEWVIPDGIDISPIVLTAQGEPKQANVYTTFEDGTLFPINALSYDDGTFVSAPLFTMDVFYTWLTSVDGDYNFHAPDNGGLKTFGIDTYFIPDVWEYSDSQGALDDWVHCSANFDQSAGVANLNFEVDELPSDLSGRYTHVTVSNPGSSALFIISQGDATGVESVDSSALVVTVENGNFVVKGSNASAVEVYNVSGQKVADAAVEGETVVDAQNLESGLYILKFNDNKVIKIVK